MKNKKDSSSDDSSDMSDEEIYSVKNKNDDDEYVVDSDNDKSSTEPSSNDEGINIVINYNKGDEQYEIYDEYDVNKMYDCDGNEYNKEKHEYEDESFNKYEEEIKEKKDNDKIMFIIRRNNKQPKLINNIIDKMKNRKDRTDKNNITKTIKKKKYKDLLRKCSCEEKTYFNNLPEYKKDIILDNENELYNEENKSLINVEPLRFKFLNMNTTINNKLALLSKLDQLNRMSPCSSEFFKLNNWITGASNIPFGIYKNLPLTKHDKVENISKYLQSIKEEIDKNIYGHDEVKEQIIRILAQWISFPDARGYVIGIQGSMGVGKTKLVKEGICNVLKYPFSFISLGGTSDASFLKGHGFTYEGSTHGKIVESLIKAKVMNPVFYFDELDKVSTTYRGDEIINTLIHITDSSQNEKFTDRYFEELDIDLSKSLIIFSYNDESLINPILKDRMITIRVNGYKSEEKVIIARDYLIPEIIKEYGIKNDDIVFSDDILKYIITITEEEQGVRNLKRNINNIISWVNMIRYIPRNDITIKFPYNIDEKFCDKYINKSYGSISKAVQLSLYT